MSGRRSLVEGLNETPKVTELENDFVFGEKANETAEPSETSNAIAEPQIMPQYQGRVPLTTRCRPELASAIKRASLERQLKGIEPSSIQDIIEEALETWLGNQAPQK
ncbi:MAG: hypothetical protein AAF802_04015 [Planctomycetota bacterium]